MLRSKWVLISESIEATPMYYFCTYICYCYAHACALPGTSGEIYKLEAPAKSLTDCINFGNSSYAVESLIYTMKPLITDNLRTGDNTCDPAIWIVQCRRLVWQGLGSFQIFLRSSPKQNIPHVLSSPTDSRLAFSSSSSSHVLTLFLPLSSKCLYSLLLVSTGRTFGRHVGHRYSFVATHASCYVHKMTPSWCCFCVYNFVIRWHDDYKAIWTP